ncbi:MAG: hypothetical protein IH881_06150 [Myxococcales bacterium]|nr:hypothetical protein [Myxococcales bacterium]
MTRSFAVRGVATIACVAVVLPAAVASAAYKMEMDETRWISLGANLRTIIGARQNRTTPKASDDDWAFDIDLETAWMYLSGQVHEWIKFDVNVDLSSTGTSLLDGIVKFEINDQLNVWGGRMIPPSARANFSGPFFLNTWVYPLVSDRFPQIFSGRDDGVAFWGQVGDGMFKYHIGLFEGAGSESKLPSIDAKLSIAFLDPEPGYYNSSTYFGEKDILTLGAVVQYQADGAGEGHDFTGLSIDLLFEKNLDDLGTPMLDAAWFFYDNNGGSTAAGNARPDGTAYYITAGWYLPGLYGPGKLKGQLQPHVRYQAFNANNGGENERRWDVGINYYVKQMNAKFVVYYGNQDSSSTSESSEAYLGFQLLF